MIKFGTDGIRGKFGKDLTLDIAYKCGNAIKGNIVIGQDTRESGNEIVESFIRGALDAGNSITSVGVCPTAGIAYLTQACNFDYGFVITASHNPSEYNGIKLFSGKGTKVDPYIEQAIETHINSKDNIYAPHKGDVTYSTSFVDMYKDFLTKKVTNTSLNNLHIVLDCANGASYNVAPIVFHRLGARITVLGCEPNGTNINDNCGSLHIENLQQAVLQHKADMGFAFDGDSDRLIAVDEHGQVVDGDMVLYMLALDYLKQGKLGENPIVVGTKMSNLGMEKALNAQGITLTRTDVGDKYVNAELERNNLLLGAEQSGHILIKDKHSTGDGILSAIMVADTCVRNNKKLSEFFDFELYKQSMINVQIEKRDEVFASTELAKVIEEQTFILGDDGRIIVRKSGTEPLIRIMVESNNEYINNMISSKIETTILKLNSKLLKNATTTNNYVD